MMFDTGFLYIFLCLWSKESLITTIIHRPKIAVRMQNSNFVIFLCKTVRQV